MGVGEEGGKPRNSYPCRSSNGYILLAANSSFCLAILCHVIPVVLCRSLIVVFRSFLLFASCKPDGHFVDPQLSDQNLTTLR